MRPGLALLLALLPFSASAADAFDTRHYDSGGHAVAIDELVAGDAAAQPAVILLHGRGGMALYGADFQARAARLSAAGFAVFIPHYFDATADGDAPQVTAERFERWRQALADALTFVSADRRVDGHRVAVIGVSLGGFLAGVEAVQDDRIAALVSESSGVSSYFPSRPQRMPPLLILHARGDTLVPLDSAEQLAAIARRLGVEPQTAILAGNRHILSGDAATVAGARTLGFLRATLLR